MRFLADENFPAPIVRGLRERSEDVVWIAEDMRAATDEAVLARAQVERRIVLTFDKDFGELAFHAGLPSGCGVVLFRLTGESPEEDNARALAALISCQDWENHFVVVQDDRIRVRLIPSKA